MKLEVGGFLKTQLPTHKQMEVIVKGKEKAWGIDYNPSDGKSWP